MKKLYEIQIPVAPNADDIRLGDTRLVCDDRLVRENPSLNKFQWIFSESHNETFYSFVSHTAGGFTVFPKVVGNWVDRSTPKFTQYTEQMVPVRVFCTADEIEGIAEFAKAHYTQESIFVAELGTAHFF